MKKQSGCESDDVFEIYMRVLIIEDEIRIARNITRVLDEECSWAVDICADGEDGRHMAMTNPYDLIILDLGLPNMTALNLLKKCA